eukprot:1150220-Amphidinium_carterae.2
MEAAALAASSCRFARVHAVSLKAQSMASQQTLRVSSRSYLQQATQRQSQRPANTPQKKASVVYFGRHIEGPRNANTRLSSSALAMSRLLDHLH